MFLVPKFWNVTAKSETEGEITLYGDIVSRKPTDYWTGEEAPGLYITPEGFLEDLEAVKDKDKITVKLNSTGGDLYTGIAIHNALASLKGDVNVVVEGIAASAASVIMCAGDVISVYPGSLIMIHGVSVLAWDYMDIQDMQKLLSGMEASEKAVAEIYSARTGLEVSELRELMTAETWYTGVEAVEAGFADTVIGPEVKAEVYELHEGPRFLMINGIRHDVSRYHLPEYIEKTAQPEQKIIKEERKMTLDELRSAYPEIVVKIERQAIESERSRIQEIDDVAVALPLNSPLVKEAKYGETACTAQELSFRVLKQSAEAGQTFLSAFEAGVRASNTADVGAAPIAADETPADTTQEDVQAVVNAYLGTRR